MQFAFEIQIKMLQKLITKVWKFLSKTSVMKFLSVKLQAYSAQTATLR